MPIYEFYCPGCNTIFNFFSRRIDTKKRPSCPKCKRPKLKRQISMFAMTGKAQEGGADTDLPIDEAKMEQAMNMLAGEAEKINEDDPRQAANLMRKLSDATGLELNDTMKDALGRLEAGEDPDSIEADMGDLMNSDEDPFVLPGKSAGPKRRPAPSRDETLYEM